MTITKCDLCKKNIVREKIITAGLGYSHLDLCEKCGSPVLTFLKKNKLPEDFVGKLKSLLKKEKSAR